MLSAFLAPTDWVLEISPDKQAAVWQQSQAYNHAWGRWNAYLNQLCLDTILPWLKTEYLPTATTWVTPALMPRWWDLVNGSVITVGTKRIALIPTEAIDRSLLEVPQEWVDIPTWAADYYLGVQVASDSRAISIYGYTTHQQLKTNGDYDPQDRTYCLEHEELNGDLNGLWLTIDRYTTAVTRATLPAIPALDIITQSARVTAIIERLADPTVMIPRLTVPFQLWAAILEEPELHQRLSDRRSAGLATPVVTQLSNWLQGQIDHVWQSLELVLLPQQIATAVRSGNGEQRFRGSLPAQTDLYRAKVYSTATGQLALVIGISPINEGESRIGLQIHPAGGGSALPGATRLRLLTVDGDEIGQASATVTETIQFQFRANVGEQFQVEIACAGEIWTEKFAS